MIYRDVDSFFTDLFERKDENPEPIEFVWDGCSVRVISDDGFPWFELSDVVRELYSDKILDEYDAGAIIDTWLGDAFLTDYSYEGEDGEEYVYLTPIDGVNLLIYLADTWQAQRLERTIEKGIEQLPQEFSGLGFAVDESKIDVDRVINDDEPQKVVTEVAPLEKAIIAANLTNRELLELAAARARKSVQYCETFAYLYLLFQEMASQCDDDRITDCFTDDEVNQMLKSRILDDEADQT